MQGISVLKSGQNIIFQENEKEAIKTAIVLGRAGKDTDKYKNWFNRGVKLASGDYVEKSIDISTLSKLEIVEENEENSK